MVTSRIWVPAMAGGFVLIVLTLVFGRFFCGWVCPLGTILDLVGRFWRGSQAVLPSDDQRWRRVKYYVLIFLIVSGLAGSQLLYVTDPLVVLFRSVAFGMAPSALNQASVLSLLILLIIIGLSVLTHRFWCRYLCPLGAFYGSLSRFSIFRRDRKKGCDACKGLPQPSCQQVCPMGASPVAKKGSPEECIRSMNCRNACPREVIAYPASSPLPRPRENLIQLDRRTFVVSMGSGLILGLSTRRARAGTNDSWRVVRPPLVTDSSAFLDLCVRCGHCVRTCPTGTLQPLWLQAGFYGLWTPVIRPEIGGCKDDCNACSTVCPTGAIPKFGPMREQKWFVKMGQVLFESHLCISYADDALKPCLECVKVCPNRAIKIDWTVHPKRPKTVDYARCVGCGLCETACLKKVIGKPALTLTSNGVGTPTALVADPTPRLPRYMEPLSNSSS